MSEMLGNRYFLARKFDRAIPELEKALENASQDQNIKKKLIICYVQVGRIEQALQYFLELLKKDPQIIINTDPYYDDCPCPSLVDQWEKIISYKQEEIRMEYVALGILYLYCDIRKSIDYFNQALRKMEDNEELKLILKILYGLKKKTGQPAS